MCETTFATCPYCGGPALTAKGTHSHTPNCPSLTRADRLSAAQEGVVKALEEVWAAYTNAPNGIAFASKVTNMADKIPAALKELREAQ